MKHQFRILCVDNDDTCELLATTLGFSDIEGKATGSIVEALRLAQHERFDLYLLETRLPDGDGFQLCRCLHSLAPQTPIVFYSAEAYPADRQKGLAAGATAYLVKPYFDDLASTLLQIIKRTEKSVSKSLAAFTDVQDRHENTFKLKPNSWADCASATG